MNKKLTVRAYNGSMSYCVLSSGEDYDRQVAKVMGYDSNHGIAARISGDQIWIVDYYHDEKMGSMDIVSFEDTDLDVSLCWTAITNG